MRPAEAARQEIRGKPGRHSVIYVITTFFFSLSFVFVFLCFLSLDRACYIVSHTEGDNVDTNVQRIKCTFTESS